MKFKLLIFIGSLMLIFFAEAQKTCAKVNAGTFSGSTQNGAFDKYGSVANISLDTLGSQVIIPDFTAGFLSEFNEEGISVALEMDCSGQVIQKTIATKFGQAVISGSYDPANEKLTLNWEIPNNQLIETSIFIRK